METQEESFGKDFLKDTFSSWTNDRRKPEKCQRAFKLREQKLRHERIKKFSRLLRVKLCISQNQQKNLLFLPRYMKMEQKGKNNQKGRKLAEES